MLSSVIIFFNHSSTSFVSNKKVLHLIELVIDALYDSGAIDDNDEEEEEDEIEVTYLGDPNDVIQLYYATLQRIEFFLENKPSPSILVCSWCVWLILSSLILLSCRKYFLRNINFYQKKIEWIEILQK
jgi:hypothetical protein